MKINYKEILNLPVVEIENFYTTEENNSLISYCETTAPISWNRPKIKNVPDATLNYGEEIKNNYGIQLDELYTQAGRNICPVFKINRKIFYPEIKEKLKKLHTFFRYLDTANRDYTWLHYYKDNDYFDEHNDLSLISAVSVFFKEPKGFKGGDFFIEGTNFKCKNKSIIIFPSILLHKISPVETKKADIHSSRFSMTQFIYCDGLKYK